MNIWRPSVGLALLLATTSAFPSGAARARFYEEDTHFSLTYALMRIACFSHREALEIASVDQSIDDCSNTDPFFNDSHNWKWHALDDSRAAVLGRKRHLRDVAFASKDLIKLGEYFHYQEDSWGHRQGHGVTEDWQPYGPTFGHAKDLAQPDRVPYDKPRAIAMAKEKLADAREFVKELGHTQMELSSDDTDALIGKLIDAQCMPYTHNAFGLWNEVDPDEVAASLDNVLQQWYHGGKIAKEIKCPRKKDKLHYQFDEDGNCTNKPEMDAQLTKIPDYNFPLKITTIAIKKPETPKTAVPDKPKTPEKPKVDVPNQPEHAMVPPKTAENLSSTVKTTFSLVDSGKTADGVVEWCYNNYDGLNRPCREVHGEELKPKKVFLYDALDRLVAPFDAPSATIGQESPLTREVCGFEKTFLDGQSSMSVRMPAEHFAPPNSASMLDYGYKIYDVQVHAEFTTTFTLDGVKQTLNYDSSGVVGQYWQPDPMPIKTLTYTRDPAKDPSTWGPLFPPPGRTPTEFMPSPGILLQQPSPGALDLSHVVFRGFNMSAVDMEEVDDGYIYYFPGGEMFYCDNPDCQGEVTLYDSPVKGSLGDLSWGGTSLTGGPFVQQKAKALIPTACTDISKKAPDPSVTFHLAPTRDPVLRRLALVVDWESIRGPWDQARVWIYMNHASWEQINARMIPGVTMGQYVKCLYEVSENGHVDLGADAYKNLLEPKFLFDPFGSRAATLWFIGRLSSQAPAELAKTISDGCADWGSKLQDNDRDYPHAVDILDGLYQTPSPELHDVIPKLIASLPDAARERILRKTILGKVRGSQ